MEFQHACSFCGWSRPSPTPVMLSPSCERCGCALDATAAPRDDPRAPTGGVPLPPLAVAAFRAIGVLCCVLMMYASVRLGWKLAGPSGGMIAFGAGGFLLLPFVPERVGAKR